MIELLSEIFNSLGRKGDTASSTGSANAKLDSITAAHNGSGSVQDTAVSYMVVDP